MATFQQWTYPPPEAVYNPSTSANVSSYFIRPNRVVKPNSRNNSPRDLARRKTTTGASTSSRTKSAINHIRPTAQKQSNPSRPVSWHPGYLEASNFTQSPTVDGDNICWDYSTAQVNGLITPVSYPSMNVPQIQEPFVPLDELSTENPSMVYRNEQCRQQTWLSQGQAKTEIYYPPFSSEASMQPSWQFTQMTTVPHVQTAPSSPDALPVQNVRLDTVSLGASDRKLPAEVEDLIGMGLYDSPAEVQSSSLLFGGIQGCGRKGLKLEESFEPTEQEEEDDNENGDEEGDEVDGSEDDLPNFERHLHDEQWPMTTATVYDSQSIASHMAYGNMPEPEPLASTYLATLRQMNSAYYPSDYSAYGQGYGWI